MAADLERELTVACTIVQICAGLTDRLQKETISADSAVAKSDYSPVTIADFAVQALLTCALHDLFKTDEFLAEESADDLRTNPRLRGKVFELIESVKSDFARADPPLQTPASPEEMLDMLDLGGKNVQSDAPRTWVFDPIDGTQTFLKGQQYCINVALLRDGKEEMGIIGCPNLRLDSPTASEHDVDEGLGLIIHAVRGQGTWLRPMQPGSVLTSPKPIERHGDRATMDQLVWSDGYTSTIASLHQQVAAKLGIAWPGVDLYSSVLKYAALGLGRCSICIRIFKFASWRSNIWDHAGGVLVATEAGCRITDLNGKDIDFTTGRKMADNYGLICAPSSVYDEVFKVIQGVLDDHGPIPWDRASVR